jgi:uncharacterized protein YegL
VGQSPLPTGLVSRGIGGDNDGTAKGGKDSGEEMAHHPNTHVCLVLDASGSMQLRHAQALDCVNDFIRSSKRDRDLYEASFSLITFNSEAVNAIRKAEVMEPVKLVTADEYRCAHLTPLFDAIGLGVGLLDEAEKLSPNPSKTILAIVTDGMENASQEFNYERINRLIEDRQKLGRLVIFLGAGLEVAQQGVQMGATNDNVVQYVGDGLRNAGRVLLAATCRFVRSEDAAFTAEERLSLLGTEEL